MNTASINGLAINGAPGGVTPPTPFPSRTTFASTGTARGVDAARSTGRESATAAELAGTGTIRGVDPARSTGRGT